MTCPDLPRDPFPQTDAEEAQYKVFLSHLPRCSDCTVAWKRQLRLETRLRAALAEEGPSDPETCPEPHELLEWLHARHEEWIEEHLTLCAPCRGDLLAAAEYTHIGSRFRVLSRTSSQRHKVGSGRTRIGSGRSRASSELQLAPAAPRSPRSGRLRAASERARVVRVERPSRRLASSLEPARLPAWVAAAAAIAVLLPLGGMLYVAREPDTSSPVVALVDAPVPVAPPAPRAPVRPQPERQQPPQDDPEDGLESEADFAQEPAEDWDEWDWARDTDPVPAEDPQPTGVRAQPPLTRVDPPPPPPEAETDAPGPVIPVVEPEESAEPADVALFASIDRAKGIRIKHPGSKRYAPFEGGDCPPGSELKASSKGGLIAVDQGLVYLAPRAVLACDETLSLDRGQMLYEGRQLTVQQLDRRLELVGQALLMATRTQFALACLQGSVSWSDDTEQGVLLAGQRVKASRTRGWLAAQQIPGNLAQATLPSWTARLRPGGDRPTAGVALGPLPVAGSTPQTPDGALPPPTRGAPVPGWGDPTTSAPPELGNGVGPGRGNGGVGNGAGVGSGLGQGNGQGNGNGAANGQGNGNGAANGQGNGNGAANGQGNGNGAANGAGNGNGAANGQGNGNGAADGQGNGNGAANGAADGQGNGNGAANGAGNGNGAANGAGSGNGASNGAGAGARPLPARGMPR